MSWRSHPVPFPKIKGTSNVLAANAFADRALACCWMWLIAQISLAGVSTLYFFIMSGKLTREVSEGRLLPDAVLLVTCC